jgi:hypothetical protein
MLRKRVLVSIAALGFAAALPSAVYGQLVTNGGFESNTGNGQLGYNATATDWTVSGAGTSYTFLFTAGGSSPSGTTADSGGAPGQYGTVSLWGPGDGSNNGLTLSPTGGAFIGMDSSFQVGSISQTINGLTAGQTYALSFDWATAQQSGFTGATYGQWQVSLGSQTLNTSVSNIPTMGFSGWMHQVLDYTASGPTETLSFIAAGGPSGLPPFALLDSVSMQAVPEKGSGVAMLLGVVGFGVFARRRARSAKPRD